MPDSSNKKPKLRSNPKSFPVAVRWTLDQDYWQKLSPSEQEWLLKFNEAEVGNNPKLLYKTKAQQRRCWNNVTAMKTDALTTASHEVPMDEVSFNRSPEEAINRLIDSRHVVRRLEREAEVKAKNSRRTKKMKKARD